MTPEEIEKRTKEYFSAFPRFELDKARLREVRREDATAYYDYIRHPEVIKFLPVDCWPDSLEWAEQHMKYWRSQFIHQTGICWTIADKKTDKMIGSVNMNRVRVIQRKAVFSYDLDYEYWGQGIMTEALGAVIKFSDKHMDLTRLYACASVSNHRSRKLLEKLGFKHEGIMRKYEVLNWKQEDFDSFARIR